MSDFTDKVDEKRRKEIHYKTALESFKVELKDFEGSKKERILYLAKLKEETGCPKEEISERVGNDLEGYLTKRYVREVLGDDFKQKNQVRDQAQSDTVEDTLRGTSSASDTEKKKLLVSADGQTISTIEEDSGDRDDIDANPVDPIYGKSLQQMKREADNEVDEDQEETLENPRNVSNLITDIPEDLRSKLAKADELEERNAHLTEERDSYKNLYERNKKLSPRLLMSENEELKVKNRQLETIQNTSNEEVKKEFSYEFLEVRKLSTLRDGQIRMMSAKAEKTIFLWINPKSQEILDVKTDKEHHRIMAIRRREQEASEQGGGAAVA